MSFEIELEDLDIDPSKFLPEREITKIANQELSNTIVRLGTQIERGKDANGKPLKKYSRSYQEAIKAGDVIANGVAKQPGPTNLTISGTLIRSRTVTNLRGGAESGFEGSMAKRTPKTDRRVKNKATGGKPKITQNQQLANTLYKMGYVGWHEFGRKDIKRIEKRFADEAEKAAGKAIK